MVHEGGEEGVAGTDIGGTLNCKTATPVLGGGATLTYFPRWEAPSAPPHLALGPPPPSPSPLCPLGSHLPRLTPILQHTQTPPPVDPGSNT